MGGNARKRRQRSAGSRAVEQARGTGMADGTKKTIVAIVGVIVLAVVVIGGVLWTNASKNETTGQAITPKTDTSLRPEYAGTRQGAAAVSGNPEAPHSLDIYADFLCPICGTFQETYGKPIEEKINSGQLKVTYHMVPMLSPQSNPPGYSMEAANAALAAADAGKFTQFHDSLFAQQPSEGGRGYDKQQLIQLGKDLGITDPKFADAVNNGKYEQEITQAFNETQNQPWFNGTPTVLHNGEPTDAWRKDENWLSNLDK